jgi:hypothetical protein
MKNLMVLFIISFMTLALAVSLLFLERILGMEMTDYSLLIWDFAGSTTAVLVTVTVVKYEKGKKKKKKVKKTYSKPSEQYRTDYY